MHFRISPMVLERVFYNIDLKYGRTALRLIRRHERCSRKLARYANHLTFLIRCVRNHVVPRDLRVCSPVPTKGGHRVAELASLRLLRERIRLAQRAKGNAMKDSHSTAKSITTTLSPKDASEILENISCNTTRLFNKTRDRQKRKFDNLFIEKQLLLCFMLERFFIPRISLFEHLLCLRNFLIT